MTDHSPTEPITVKTSKGLVDEIDALAAATRRSRSEIVDQALRQYLDANAWQMERIKAGLTAAREGHVTPADEVFAEIAERHGWQN
jgi:predicted transcriptional regulator